MRFLLAQTPPAPLPRPWGLVGGGRGGLGSISRSSSGWAMWAGPTSTFIQLHFQHPTNFPRHFSCPPPPWESLDQLQDLVPSYL